LGFGVFDVVSLPYQKFCFKNNIRKIHVKLVTEMVQFRKITNYSSQVEEK